MLGHNPTFAIHDFAGEDDFGITQFAVAGGLLKLQREVELSFCKQAGIGLG